MATDSKPRLRERRTNCQHVPGEMPLLERAFSIPSGSFPEQISYCDFEHITTYWEELPPLRSGVARRYGVSFAPAGEALPEAG